MIATEYCVKVFDGTHDSPKPVENGRLLITSKHIADRSLDTSSAYLISDEDFENVNKRSQVHQWDILFSMIGTVGNVYIETSEKVDYAIKNMGVFSCQNKEKAYWLYYYLQSPLVKAKIDALMAGAVQKFVPLGFLRDLDIPEYTENAQNIVAALSALDDKIALNKKMNQKLEAMAKRLYDYWFVQFDFPDENGRPYKTSGGPMVYNPTLKREIPVGWEVSPISDLIEKNFNGEWGNENPSVSDDIRVHCVRGADIVDMIDMPIRYISTKKRDRILNANDIIVEVSGGSPTQSTGRASFVTQSTLDRFDSPMTSSNFCQIIRLKDSKNASYFFEMWRKFYASDIFFNFEGKTSGIKNFQTDAFIATPWLNPPKVLMHKFDDIYQIFMKKKERLIAENQKLTTLRDKLLPLLMNGQVVVG